jgi:Flp pilus assembly protein TadD
MEISQRMHHTGCREWWLLLRGDAMVYRRLCAMFVVGLWGLWLGGCASTPVASLPPGTLWQDAAFDYQSARVTETRETLFALDPELAKTLRDGDTLNAPTHRRLERLLARLYRREGILLSYSSGHTTGAMETWNNKRGDCLSLSILAYAAATTLLLDAHMQEVPVPLVVDRRGGLDYISSHVNVFVTTDSEIALHGQVYGAQGFVIDFEPQPGSRRAGQWLTEDAILARYYSNRGTEYLAAQDRARAYAYYRAAIVAAPDFAPAYANLAHLYAAQGLLVPAEQLLLHAIALGGPSYAPLRSLQRLLAAQGRDVEARHYADLLSRRQDEDPYYWFGLGIAALGEGHNGAAIRALERAASLASGFEEIHYNLGLAYWRNGQREAAGKQLAALRAINQRDPGVAVLTKKMQSVAPS